MPRQRHEGPGLRRQEPGAGRHEANGPRLADFPPGQHRRGPATPVTLRLIQAWGANLLVAGHSRGSAVRRWLVGDIHRELLRAA